MTGNTFGSAQMLLDPGNAFGIWKMIGNNHLIPGNHHLPKAFLWENDRELIIYLKHFPENDWELIICAGK